MKRLIALFILLLTVLVGCGKTTETPENPLDGWPEAASLDAEETPEQLYEAARGEGLLVVYSISSRAFDAAASFETEYPGLIVQVNDIRGVDLIERLKSEYASGNVVCDVVICGDSDGELSQDLVKNSVLYKYVPYDIEDKLIFGNNGETLSFVGEAEMLFYNADVFTEAPIENWWELTEEQWRGRIYMPNPFKSLSNIALMSMIIKNSDMMAEAYADRYGKQPDLSPDENAGELFVRLLFENGVRLTNTGDECVELVGTSTADNPALAIMISSKLRMRDVGYEIQTVLDAKPFNGLYTPNSVMIAGGARNVNAAKLFIRWLLGEADGHGDGNKPYLENGAWAVRNDVHSVTAFSYEDINLMFMDTEYVYNSREDVLAFLTELIEGRTEK
jgi:iron(III) transport system substrate-binding protein